MLKITIWVEDEEVDFKSKTIEMATFEGAEEEFGKMRRRYEKIAALPKEEVDF